jgi:hypothetical protein
MEPDVVKIKVDKHLLEGNLNIPPKAHGIVLFAHGSGSSRHSPRNQFVAKVLQEKGLATLLIDLLSSEEELEDERTRELRFNIPMLTKRLVEIIDWLVANPETRALKIGLFGASTGLLRRLELRRAWEGCQGGGFAWRASRSCNPYFIGGKSGNASDRGRRGSRSDCDE